jgi:hypothetical protein
MSEAKTREELGLQWRNERAFDKIIRTGGRTVAAPVFAHDGDFIVTAANAHHDLVEALHQCQRTLAILIDPANKGSGIDNMAAWASCVATEANARAALAKAKGGAS